MNVSLIKGTKNIHNVTVLFQRLSHISSCKACKEIHEDSFVLSCQDVICSKCLETIIKCPACDEMIDRESAKNCLLSVSTYKIGNKIQNFLNRNEVSTIEDLQIKLLNKSPPKTYALRKANFYDKEKKFATSTPKKRDLDNMTDSQNVSVIETVTINKKTPAKRGRKRKRGNKDINLSDEVTKKSPKPLDIHFKNSSLPLHKKEDSSKKEFVENELKKSKLKKQKTVDISDVEEKKMKRKYKRKVRDNTVPVTETRKSGNNVAKSINFVEELCKENSSKENCSSKDVKELKGNEFNMNSNILQTFSIFQGNVANEKINSWEHLTATFVNSYYKLLDYENTVDYTLSNAIESTYPEHSNNCFLKMLSYLKKISINIRLIKRHLGRCMNEDCYLELENLYADNEVQTERNVQDVAVQVERNLKHVGIQHDLSVKIDKMIQTEKQLQEIAIQCDVIKNDQFTQTEKNYKELERKNVLFSEEIFIPSSLEENILDKKISEIDVTNESQLVFSIDNKICDVKQGGTTTNSQFVNDHFHNKDQLSICFESEPIDNIDLHEEIVPLNKSIDVVENTEDICKGNFPKNKNIQILQDIKVSKSFVKKLYEAKSDNLNVISSDDEEEVIPESQETKTVLNISNHSEIPPPMEFADNENKENDNTLKNVNRSSQPDDDFSNISFCLTEASDIIKRSVCKSNVKELPNQNTHPSTSTTPKHSKNNKTTIPVVACTRLPKNKVLAILHLQKLKLLSYSNTYSDNVTHMIVLTNDDNVLEDHTTKYIMSVAAGIWVLNFKWIEKCMESKSIVSEEPYEVCDQCGVPAPRLSRLATRRNIFKDFKFYAAPPFASIDKTEVESIIRMLGGKVASSVKELAMSKKTRLIIAEMAASNQQDQYNVYLAKYNILTIDLEWLSLSVGAFQVLSLKQHILCDYVNNSSLNYPASLLEDDENSD